MKLSAPLRAIVLAVAILTSTSASLVAATPAQAVSCYGDWCSGQNPETTGCSVGAKPVASTRLEIMHVVPGTDQVWWQDIGLLELRWSPTCKTNWARVSLSANADYMHTIIVQQDSSYEQRKSTQGYLWGTRAGVFYTNMIYSPVRRCYARVEGGYWRRSWTDWM